MPENIKMDKASFTLQDLVAFLGGGVAIAAEEFIKHPIGGLVSLILLLLTYERWRTQRVAYKIKVHELEDIEKDEGIIRLSKKRTEGTKD